MSERKLRHDFLCIAKEDSFSEIIKVTHTVRYSFQHFGLIAAALNISDIHQIQDLLEPVMAGRCAVVEFRHIYAQLFIDDFGVRLIA